MIEKLCCVCVGKLVCSVLTIPGNETILMGYGLESPNMLNVRFFPDIHENSAKFIVLKEVFSIKN